MRVCHVHLPRFPLQRKVGQTPSLARAPIALVEEVRAVRRVAFASAAALSGGVRPGMTLTAACALVPSLQHFPYEPAVEEKALTSLGEALMVVAPAFQLSAPDGLWLDAAAAGLCGGEAAFSDRVLQLCAAHGYRARAVVSSDLFSARALARFGTQRAQVVGGAQTAGALAPLPLVALEAVAPLEAELRSLGLSTLGEVAALPAGAVSARLGAAGRLAQRWALGEDDRLLVPAVLPERIEEAVALDWPAESLEPLLFSMKTALDRACARLSGRGRAAVRLTLRLSLEPQGHQEVGLSLARPSAQSKLLLELARHRISDLTLPAPVAGFSVRIDEACEHPGQQQSLGDGPQGDAALEVVLSRLASALGEEALFSAELHGSHRPEASYRPRPFRLPKEEGRFAEERAAAGAATPGPPLDETHVQRPPRVFARPAVLDAEVDDAGTLRSVRLLGQRRTVEAMAGPERLVGEWWSQDRYARDYYRVHLEGVGPAWIYRDAQDGCFYLQGMFD